MKMLPHYKEMHPDVMASNSQAEKVAWMAEFDRRWEVA